MKTKILASVALASLMSLSFIACSSEPKSVEELQKSYSSDELKKMFEQCRTNLLKSGQLKEAKLFPTLTDNDYVAEEIEKDPSKFSKEIVECFRTYTASLNKELEELQKLSIEELKKKYSECRAKSSPFIVTVECQNIDKVIKSKK